MLFVFTALINNHDAWVLVDTALTKHNLDIQKVLQLFECMLCFDRWCRKAQYWTMEERTAEQGVALEAIRMMLNLLMDALPQKKGNGWALSKVHDLLHVPMFITMFGAPMNYNTGFCEHNHKYQAKIPGRHAAKRHSTFTKSIATSIVDTYLLDVFETLVDKHNKKLHGSQVETIDDPQFVQNDQPQNDNIVESVKYATTCHIAVANNNIVVEWNTCSESIPSLSAGMVRFIVCEFDLAAQPNKSVILYTQYKRNGTTFHCHPCYRGGEPWYDWMVLMYMDDNYPNQALTCPVRLMAVVVENDAPNKVYHPIVQWAGNGTYNDSVLFDEYMHLITK